MNKLQQKLRSQTGESIAETLISLLIASLALTLLAGSITTAARIIKISREKLDTYYSANEEKAGVVWKDESKAELIPAELSEFVIVIPASEGKTVTIKQGSTDIDTCNIILFQNKTFEDIPVISYKKYKTP